MDQPSFSERSAGTAEILAGIECRPLKISPGAVHSNQEAMMILLIAWKVRPGQRDAAVQRFKETQGAPPPGVKMLNRWHRADGDGGLTIAESDDPQALYKWAYQWGDVMELDAHPIIDDAEAAKVLFG